MNLRKEMKQYRLGDICKVRLGASLKPSDYEKLGIPVLKSPAVKDGFISEDIVFYCDPKKAPVERLVKFGDIVITRTKPIRIGVNLTDRDYLFLRSIFKLEPNLEIVNKKYLYYLLSNHLQDIESRTTTGNLTCLYRDSLLKISVSVPDLETQSKIVKYLDTIQELREELRLRKKQGVYYRNKIMRSLQERSSLEG